jgi:hypothetical protein
MTAPIARDSMYRRRRFEAEIIELCVRWYITYRLSYRDLVAMMAERGVAVSHTTILRWVIRYVPEFEKRWNRWARRVNSSWRVDLHLRAGQMALPLSRGRQARQDCGLSASSRSGHRGGPGVLQKGIDDEPAAVAAKDHPRRPRSEPSSAAPFTSRKPKVEVRAGEELQIPQQHRRAGSSRGQTTVHFDDGLQELSQRLHHASWN